MGRKKKEVWLDDEIIEFINKNYGGKYSEFCRIAVEEKVKKEQLKKEDK